MDKRDLRPDRLACASVIFDFDGTLLDSMGIWKQIDIDFMSRRGLEVPEDYQRIISPMGAMDCARYTIDRFGLPERPEDLVAEWMHMAEDAYRCHLPLKAGVLDYVRALHERGIPLSIASASNEGLILAALDRTGLLPMMETVVTAEDVSRGKEFPDIYLEAAGRLGSRIEDCIVFEDILTGIRSARRGGFQVVGVYDSHNERDEAEIRRESDCYIMSFTDLL